MNLASSSPIVSHINTNRAARLFLDMLATKIKNISKNAAEWIDCNCMGMKNESNDIERRRESACRLMDWCNKTPVQKERGESMW